jgi:predicted  nucleic acid-binding Zn-ribbon protein
MSAMTMKASYGELKEEVREMKKRIAALERAFDAIATRDDIQAIEGAHEDLRQGRTSTIAQAKNSIEV